jgi:hypothetical protein
MKGPTYVAFDGMTWPNPADPLEVEWSLRYGAPSREQMLVAASVVAAYRQLVEDPQRIRNGKVATLRQALAAAEQPEPARDRYMIATTAIHKLGDISRDEPALAVIYGETETDWIGQWVAGFGMVNVAFPKATTRELTEDEKVLYRTKVVQIGSHGAVERIRIDDEPAHGGTVATQEPAVHAEEATDAL